MKRIKLSCLPLVLIPALLNAQSITVISGGGDARTCSFSAERSARLNVPRSDLEACNRALNEMHLSRRDRAATFVNRGIVHTALDNYQDALNDYNAALEIDPGLPQAWNGKGNLYFLAERFNEAIDAYELSLELNLPEAHVAHYNLGLVYEKTGDDEMAVKSYNTALELAPEWPLPRNKLLSLQARRASPANG